MPTGTDAIFSQAGQVLRNQLGSPSTYSPVSNPAAAYPVMPIIDYTQDSAEMQNRTHVDLGIDVADLPGPLSNGDRFVLPGTAFTNPGGYTVLNISVDAANWATLRCGLRR